MYKCQTKRVEDHFNLDWNNLLHLRTLLSEWSKILEQVCHVIQVCSVRLTAYVNNSSQILLWFECLGFASAHCVWINQHEHQTAVYGRNVSHYKLNRKEWTGEWTGVHKQWVLLGQQFQMYRKKELKCRLSVPIHLLTQISCGLTP